MTDEPPLTLPEYNAVTLATVPPPWHTAAATTTITIATTTSTLTSSAFLLNCRIPSFLTNFSKQCYCGTKEDFDALTESDACGLTYEAYCFGDTYETCGGENAISVYSRSSTAGTQSVSRPTPSPMSYESAGCFVDGADRIMTTKFTEEVMSAEVSYGAYCTWTVECWCEFSSFLKAEEMKAVIQKQEIYACGT